MSKKFMSEEDAKEAVKLLSKAFGFVVVKKFESTVGMSGDEEEYKSESWHVSLAWSISNDRIDGVYVRPLKASKKSISSSVVSVDCKDEDFAYPFIIEILSGATLCSYTVGDDDVEDVVTIPEFSSLSQLKLLMAVRGIS